jgi:hypothetical protein
MQDEATMLNTIERITPLLGGMDRDKLVLIRQHTVDAQSRSKDTLFLNVSETFLNDIDSEFASPRLKGNYLEEGLLGFFGYHVGRRAKLSSKARQTILSAIYRRPAPPVFPRNYRDEWGDPGTPKRLERMVRTIMGFIREPKWRNDPHMEDAIAEWKEDLVYLRQAHFRGDFSWPTF